MTDTTHRHRPDIGRESSSDPDATREFDGDVGATLFELLFVMLILALLASAVVFAISGVRADAADAGCWSDRRTLAVAAESYFAQHEAAAIPATGVDGDRYERTLVAARLLRAVSVDHDLDADGVVTAEGGASC